MKNQLVTILKISTPQLGSFVKDKLEFEKVECFFTNEGLTAGGDYNPDEVYLNVKASQTLEAVQILLRIHKEFDLDKIHEKVASADFKKILVPVKLSENCIELCKYAVSLAKKTNAELKLLYVYEDPTLNEPGRHTVSWERYVKLELREANKNAKQKLVNFSVELKKNLPKELLQSVRLHYRMLKGTPVNVITEASERYHPDLILMGTCAKKESGEFMGKTTAKVIEHSKFPVLVVPFNANFKGKEKINVMYGTDFYNSDNSSLNNLLKILQPYDKTIHCVHIELHNDLKHQEKVDELNQMLAQKYNGQNIKCELFESNDVVKGFNEFIEKNEIDLLSVSKIKRSAFYKIFHSSRLQQLITTEKIPMLVFPV
jgi:nucleotide-binding universal stress UspA family protein